ncbi:hypothetical protein Pint_31510 [Pistacia integerrima]|uniref:Uncharacterized protein n=1 Tax=Pistacia integerrima TaxID=434235 RepID=A0ACC0XNV9_9ROSI|nr:hypothetical protein Pint_31510 [Pistacia integerrima]
MNFVTGDLRCPTIDAENSTTSKAANSHWIRQHKLILHALLASTSTTITLLLASCKTSHEAWNKLTRLYAIKLKADELARIDHPVADDDLTLYILNGLGPEYREIAAPIQARENPLRFEELHDLLISHESYLRRLEQQATQPLVATANYTQRKQLPSGTNGQRSSSKGRDNNKRTNNGLGFPNISPSARYAISWVTRLKHVQSILRMISQQIVQHPPKTKIING